MQTIIARTMRAAVVIVSDLSLLASLFLAQFIVRRMIHVRYQERMARLKSLKLIRGGGQASGVNQASLPAGMDEKGMLREAVRDNGPGQREVAPPSNSSGE